jgi:MoaA/NifB/PqqE/SkfB family radical SAM enzyme
MGLMNTQAQNIAQAVVSFAWLEITPNCQLTCEHCYVASRPGLGHGRLSATDWKETIDALCSLGVQAVQFIGGEPTTHPSFCELVEYAAEQGLAVEVYSNLLSITRRMWDCFTRYDVHIATSFYSAEAFLHDAITHLPGSYQKTLGNIKKVIALGLTLRVGIVNVREDQDIPRVESFLEHLGIDPDRIGVDRVRGVGRGLNLSKEDAVSALCGKCTSGQCVVTAEGTVYPCIMARSFPLGSVLRQSIADVLAGETFRLTSEVLNNAFAARGQTRAHSGSYSSCPPLCAPNCAPLCAPNCGPRCTPNCVPLCAPQCAPLCPPRTCVPSCRPSCAPSCRP